MGSDSQTRVTQSAPIRGVPVVPDWEPETTVLGLYDVRGRLGQGGMGVVYHLWHREWGIDLAVKSPRADILARPGGVESFVLEAQNWVQLGLHPHIVSCYYVRVLDGVPRVFAEYVDGGDLHQWVKDGRLYQGSPDAVLRRVLDVAIQFAWGLQYAHSMGLVHQDVKTSNVLVTRAGQAKVSDFGLARVNADGGADSSPFTPAYSSPEQSRHETLTLKTDLWSWAVSVLEMFVGRPPQWGPLALFALHDYVEHPSHLPIPEAVQQVLEWCLQDDPEARPADFQPVSDGLVELYETYFAEPYPRTRPQAASVEADALNNRAVSLLDLGRSDDALALLDRALAADARHAPVTYNRALVLWRTGRVTDDGALQALRDLETAHGEHWEIKLHMAALHRERGDDSGARRLLLEAARLAPAREGAANSLSNMQDAVAGLVPRGRCTGHAEAVTAVALSHGGQLLISGCRDGMVGVWRPGEPETPMKTRRGHQGAVNAVQITPDGRWGYTAGDDGRATVWDLQSGRALVQMQEHRGPVTCLGLAQNGQVVCTGGRDGMARVWEAASGRTVRAFHNEHSVTAVVISGTARMVLAGLENGACTVWDTHANQLVGTLRGHQGPVRGLGFLDHGRMAVSAGADGTLRLWNLERGEAQQVLSGHRGSIDALAVDVEGGWAVTGGEDRTVRIWDLMAPRCWRTLDPGQGRVHAVNVTSGVHCLALGTADRLVDLLDFCPDTPPATPAVVQPRSSEELLMVQSDYQDVLAQTYAAMEQGHVSTALDGLRSARQTRGFERSPECLELSAWLAPYAHRGALLGTWLLAALESDKSPTVAVACSPSGHQALTAAEDGTLKLWHLGDMSVVATWRLPRIKDLAWARLAPRALLATDDGLMVWDTEQGTKVRSLVGHRGLEVAVSIDAAGKVGASSAKDGTARVWDLDSGATVKTLPVQPGPLSLRSDGGTLACGSPVGACHIVDLRSSQNRPTAPPHEGAVRSVALSLDGILLLTAGDDKTVGVWDTANGRRLQVLKGHSRGVTSVATCLDGRLAVSASRDKTLILWDLARFESLGTLVGHKEAVTTVACSADGRVVVSGCNDGSVRVWYLDWELEAWEGHDWRSQLKPFVADFRGRHAGGGDGHDWTHDHVLALQSELGWGGLAGLAPDTIHQALVDG